jgi:ACT domain-containing protein
MADMKKAVVTVLGYDRKGIIAKVSDALYRYDANILDISQTILSGLFNMVLIADISSPACDFTALSDELAEYGRAQNLQIRVQRSEIFEAMHQV